MDVDARLASDGPSSSQYHRVAEGPLPGSALEGEVPMRATLNVAGPGLSSAPVGGRRKQRVTALLAGAVSVLLLVAGVGIGVGIGMAVSSSKGGDTEPQKSLQQTLQLASDGEPNTCAPCPLADPSACPSCPAFPPRDAPADCAEAQLCGDPLAVGFIEQGSEPKSQTAFKLVSPEEITAVVNHMASTFGYIPSGSKWGELPPASELDKSDIPVKGTDDVLTRVETIHPKKAEVLEYLDNNGPEPKRYAKAVVVRGSVKDVMEYKVGPIPFDAATGPEEVTKMREDGEIHWSKRPLFGENTAWQEVAVSQAAWRLRDLFRDFTGGKCYPISFIAGETPEQVTTSRAECEEGWVSWIPTPAYQPDLDKRHSVIYWQFAPQRVGGSELDLHSIPITFKIDETSQDYLEWTTFDFEYCNQGPFATAGALMAAWRNGELQSCGTPGWHREDYDFTWANTWDPRPAMPGADIPGPRLYEPGFKRYSVYNEKNAQGNRFRWMNWEGHFLMNPEHGIQLFDLQWRGQRVVYELGLQEQYVAYSGYSGNGMMLFMDSTFNLGDASIPLKVGVDCPETATYFPATRQWSLLGAGTERDIMCLFEDDLGQPSWRHSQPSSPTGARIDGMRKTALVLRSIATIGNYDYVYDIIFHLDASIEVKVEMAGYMECVYSGPGNTTALNTPFGNQVKENTFALLHDHLSSWKVDVDVHGPLNSFKEDVVRAGTYEEAFKKQFPGATMPGWFMPGLTVKYIDAIDYDKEHIHMVHTDEPSIHRFVNERVVNGWGAPAGYAIELPQIAPQLLPSSHPVTKGGSWSKYHMAITKRKDEEPFCVNAAFDFYNPGFPAVSLDIMLNNESIVGEDLVAWVTQGAHHVPRTEDLPLIQNFGTAFKIMPWNYFSELQSIMPADTNTFEPTCVPQVGEKYQYGWYFDQQAG